MKISTWNINGLRSGVRSGFESWLTASKNDIVCLQEVKTEEDLLGSVWFPGYVAHWFGSDRTGYSGVVTLVSSSLTPISVRKGIGDPIIDTEGRVISVELDKFELLNVYAPHSHRKLTRLDFKLHFLEKLARYVAERKKDKPLIIVGDLNIAHEERDLTNFAANRKNAGFLPQERLWLDGILKTGFRDAFRVFLRCFGSLYLVEPNKGGPRPEYRMAPGLRLSG